MDFSTVNDSRVGALVARLQHLGPDVAPRVALTAWRKLTIVQRAALTANWDYWVRSKQRAPENAWKTWGFLTGRGFGKTRSISKWIHGEVAAGRAPLICLIAQDEQSAIDILVEGPSGLLNTAPPWARPKWEASDLQLVWANGARAYVRTPEVPGKIRGLEYYLTWATELQSWPRATLDEAWHAGVEYSTRKGYARVVWDCTPKRRHPLLKELLAQSEADPTRNVVVRGTTHENAANLGPGYVAGLEKKYGGTVRGREELLGEMLEDSENALVRQAWIDATRRKAPANIARRVVSIDPAVTNRKGSDQTGLVEVGLGNDGQAYVFGNASGKYEPSKWVSLALDWYVDHACDLIVAETNKGGELVTQTLRAIAKERKLEVIVVGKEERPTRQAGKVFVKEVFARGSKSDRAEPVATAYERRRVSHVIGADLASLEDTLTTWEPAPNADSPGDLDALVHAVVELLDLANDAPNMSAGIVGINELVRPLLAPTVQDLATIFAPVFGSGRPERGL